MCGIFCLYPNLLFFNENGEKIKHRGEFKDTLFYDDIYMEQYEDHKENKILNTSDYILLLDGFIFNYKELNKSYCLNCSTQQQVIVELYRRYDIDVLMEVIDGEFAFVLYDKTLRKIIISRDPFGIKPLFLAWELSDPSEYTFKKIGIASEAKSLIGFKSIEQIECQRYSFYDMDTNRYFFKEYFYMSVKNAYTFPVDISLKTLYRYIKKYLNNAIRRRLSIETSSTDKETPDFSSRTDVGMLLSGGLNSSIIASLAYNLNKNIQFFTLVLEDDDMHYSTELFEFLNIPTSQCHFVHFNKNVIEELIPFIIYIIESYDPFSIRSAICEYVLCEYIVDNTDVSILLSGHGANELFSGYSFNQYAPSSYNLREDTIRLLKNIQYYDVLRIERITSYFGLTITLPFLDKYLVRLLLNSSPSVNVCNSSLQKNLLRDAFIEAEYLPVCILSRGVRVCGDNSLLLHYVEEQINDNILKNQIITNEDFEEYRVNTPRNKEEYYYRRVFEKYFPYFKYLTPHLWEPSWFNGLSFL